jgi:hypothetical protein
MEAAESAKHCPDTSWFVRSAVHDLSKIGTVRFNSDAADLSFGDGPAVHGEPGFAQRNDNNQRRPAPATARKIRSV